VLTSTDRIRSLTRAWPLAIALLLVGTLVAAQDEIQVNTAEPDMAEQATYDLEVMVGGDNFPSDAEVDFYVTGTCDYEADPDCIGDDGGITVKKVKRQGPKNLKVTIDVAEGAQVQQKFDILVRSRRGGRSGKGTELFRVTEKQHPNQDTTPPGAPLDLHVTDVTFNTLTVAWTMPADDGYLAASGRVDTCKCSPDDISYEHCGGGLLWNGMGDPSDALPWPDPGEQMTDLQGGLDQDTPYHYWVRCRDDAMNWSDPAYVVATTRPFSEFQDPSWSIVEVPIPLDALVGHGFDTAGNLVIGGVVADWDQVGKGKFSIVPTHIRIITGVQVADGWTWTFEDLPGFASRLQMTPDGRPAFEGGLVRSKRTRDLVYTFHDGLDWKSEVVTTEEGLSSPRGFEFDPAGNPAIAWCSQWGMGGVRLARRNASGQWATEQVSQDTCWPGWWGSADVAFDDLGNPAVSYWVQYEWPNPYEAKVAIWTGQAWLEEVVSRGADFPAQDGDMRTPSLVYDSVLGDFSVAGETGGWWFGCDRVGAGDWRCTNRILGSLGESRLLSAFSGQSSWLGRNIFEANGETGELFVAYKPSPAIALSRRLSGQSTWVPEYVDHPTTRDFPFDLHETPGGPFLALDPLGLPTLIWQWNIGGEPATEYHLYFAWKETP